MANKHGIQVIRDCDVIDAGVNMLFGLSLDEIGSFKEADTLAESTLRSAWKKD